MKDFAWCEEKRICFIFLGEHSRALRFFASVECVVKCCRIGLFCVALYKLKDEGDEWEIPNVM